jgi:hypothetical protein
MILLWGPAELPGEHAAIQPRSVTAASRSLHAQRPIPAPRVVRRRDRPRADGRRDRRRDAGPLPAVQVVECYAIARARRYLSADRTMAPLAS